MFKLPQEIEVLYIIPKIRSEMAKKLAKEGVSYEEIGRILGITKAAVANYIKGKRANKISFSREINEKISFSLRKIIKRESNFLIEAQRLIKSIKKTNCACRVCKKYNREVISYCNCRPEY